MLHYTYTRLLTFALVCLLNFLVLVKSLIILWTVYTEVKQETDRCMCLCVAARNKK